MHVQHINGVSIRTSVIVRYIAGVPVTHIRNMQTAGVRYRGVPLYMVELNYALSAFHCPLK